VTLSSDVATAAQNLAKARGRAAEREEKLAEVIRAALAEGWSASVIAEAAGLSRARVYQIRDGKR
jgi:hypothetical protein